MVLSVKLQNSRIKKKLPDPSEKSQKSLMKGQEYQWCEPSQLWHRKPAGTGVQLKTPRRKNSSLLTVHLTRRTGKKLESS